MLHHMGQLMGNQAHSLGRAGPEFSLGKEEVGAQGKGPCIQKVCSALGAFVHMHAYLLKIPIQRVRHGSAH